MKHMVKTNLEFLIEQIKMVSESLEETIEADTMSTNSTGPDGRTLLREALFDLEKASQRIKRVLE